MLFKKKKGAAKKTFTIPPYKAKSVEEVIDTIVKNNRPVQALGKVRRTLVFMKAKLDGTSTREARALANIPPGVSQKAILDNPLARSVMETLLEQEFSDPTIVNRLKEMWNASEVRYDPEGSVIASKPDMETRRFAFDRVLKLRKYDKGSSDNGGGGGGVAEIVFHVNSLPAKPVDDAVPITAEEINDGR